MTRKSRKAFWGEGQFWGPNNRSDSSPASESQSQSQKNRDTWCTQPIGEWAQEAHEQLFEPHPIPGQSRKNVYVWWFPLTPRTEQDWQKTQTQREEEANRHADTNKDGRGAHAHMRLEGRRAQRQRRRTANRRQIERTRLRRCAGRGSKIGTHTHTHTHVPSEGTCDAGAFLRILGHLIYGTEQDQGCNQDYSHEIPRPLLLGACAMVPSGLLSRHEHVN